MRRTKGQVPSFDEDEKKEKERNRRMLRKVEDQARSQLAKIQQPKIQSLANSQSPSAITGGVPGGQPASTSSSIFGGGNGADNILGSNAGSGGLAPISTQGGSVFAGGGSTGPASGFSYGTPRLDLAAPGGAGAMATSGGGLFSPQSGNFSLGAATPVPNVFGVGNPSQSFTPDVQSTSLFGGGSKSVSAASGGTKRTSNAAGARKR